MNQETVRLTLTEEMGDEKILCQDGIQESHRETAVARLDVCVDLLEKLKADLQLKNRVIGDDEGRFFPL